LERGCGDSGVLIVVVVLGLEAGRCVLSGVLLKSTFKIEDFSSGYEDMTMANKPFGEKRASFAPVINEFSGVRVWARSFAS
jgi:hypothetical protein